MTTLRILCPVCQAHPLDPPKACEFCPESVVRALDEIDGALERLGSLERSVAHVGAAEA